MYRFECWSSGLEASLGSLHIYGAQQLFIVLALIPSTIALMIATKLELQGIVDFQLVYNYKWVRQKKNYETSIEILISVKFSKCNAKNCFTWYKVLHTFKWKISWAKVTFAPILKILFQFISIIGGYGVLP